jgi:hypothetical protein
MALGAARAPAQEAEGARRFEGAWEATSEDGTELHAAELHATDTRVTGRVVRAQRGYFSGEVEIQERLDLEGAVRGGVLEFSGQLEDAEGRRATAGGTGVRRGEYLILRVGSYEVALAPPGVPLAVSAEGSPDAARLAGQVLGREFASSAQAHGRGAFVGKRVRLALCADGTISYSRSELVATPGALPGGGVDGGSSWSRRGRWTVVLYAGTPVVRADWEGTGSSYSLVDYIRIEPAADGSSATVDGVQLPLTGRC